jgi:glycosyltransferase involved in cell wall biosynthesis
MVASAVLPFRLSEIADCDVLLCHSQPSMWLGYRSNRLFGTPYVGYLHQLTTFIHHRPPIAGNWATKGDFLLLDGLLGVFGRPVAKHLDRLCHARASRLLFNSAWTRSLFMKEYGLSGDVLYPAIEAPLRPLEQRRKNALVTAGRHYPWKRIDLCFHALTKIRHKPLLFVTGEPTEHTPTLVKIARRLGVADQVHFTGFVSDAELFEIYASSRAYVHTSIHEPFGLSPLEAQAFGTPAVVWRDGGVMETVLDGETGFHAKPFDLNDFAKKVDILLTDHDKQEAMGRIAQMWASTFDWSDHVDFLESVLDEART